MKRGFRFRLERVARARAIFEEVSRADFAVAQAEVNRIDQRIADLRAAIVAGHQTQGALQSQGRLDVGALISRDRSLDALAAELTRLDAERAAAERVALEKRALWQSRKQDASALEQLEKRHREEHQMALQRAENVEMDEVAGRRFQNASDPDFRDSGD